MLHRLLDQVRQQERSRCLQAIHRGRLAASHALEEVLQLGIKGFDRGGAPLLDETVIPVQKLPMIRGIPLVGSPVNVQGVVQKICFHKARTAMGAETANLAVTHLARRQAGHHTVFESQGCIDVIDGAIGTAPPGRGQAHNWGLRQLQHQVDVVDHQIQDHGNIVGPIRMGTVAPALQHHHLLIGHNFDQLTERGIEPFDVAHLEQTPGRPCRLNQSRGFVLAGGDRLLNQDMKTGFEAGHPHGVMQQRGNSNADRLHLSEHGAVVREPTAAELFGGQATPVGVGVRHTNQLCIAEQTQHPGVVPSHVADADHPHLHRIHGGGGHQPKSWLR